MLCVCGSGLALDFVCGLFPRNGAQKSARDLGAEKKFSYFFLLSCSGLASFLPFLGRPHNSVCC